MATERRVVTPERVRKILSSFLSNETKKYSITDENDTASSPSSTAKQASPEEKAPEPVNLRSREAFFSRVETFSPLTWFAKPEELCALVCAQYGWENTEVDIVRCVSCRSFLCGKLPPNTDQDAYKEACKKLKTSIISGHERICTWATNPAPDWYIHVPHYDPEEVRKDFHQRYECLKTERGKLPQVNYVSLAKYGFDSYRCGKLTFSVDKSSEQDTTHAMAVAVLGWTINVKKQTLVCQHCRRHAGLWNFTPGSEVTPRSEVTPGDTGEESDDPPPKKQRLETKDSFDPSEEHRTFCPWIKLKREESSPASTQVISSNVTQNGAHNTQQSQSPKLGHSETNGHSNVSDKIESGNGGLDSSQDLDTSCESLESPEKSQQSQSSPGWVHNLHIISPNLLSNRDTFSSAIKKSPMVVGLRSIRRLFHDWAAPKANKSS